MKKHTLVLFAGLLGFGSATLLPAAPIVFQFEANAGQSTEFNGSTLTLASTATTISLTTADIQAFDLLTSAGTILDIPADVYSVFTSGISYSPTALTSPPPGGGQLDIGAYSGSVEIQIAPTDVFESGVEAAGTWTPVGDPVPDRGATLGLLGIGLLGLIVLRRRVTAQSY